ncbi:MAG: sulfite exporter TauE/SafE family protein [Desulfobulbaceae bacterium]|nr:sulfite exporter TauE/SafE family protein [Desulfobulbaceae bacterium]
MLYPSAVALGALHAFEPGHGKSLIAAYMLGTRGRALDGVILGFIVTFTHTFSVIILGLIAKLMAGQLSDAQLHNWLGLLSSLLILGVGLWMFYDRLFKERPRHFHFFCKNDHGVSGHNHLHDHDHIHPAPGGGDDKVNFWRLTLLGISGGMVPCPPAIAALLAAVAAGKIGQGLIVTLFFSLGLGIVMMGIGITLSRAGRLTVKIKENLALGRGLGLTSAGIITVLGAILLINSVREVIS